MIDLRSDTVTKPGPAMREAMARAEVGDDVFGDDPTVHRLQDAVAARLGFEAGLLFPSGTQCNLAALMTHCQRGDEYLVGQDAHTYAHEGGGAAVLGSIQPQPLEYEPDGTIALARIGAAIKPRDDHYARTRLLALENTLGGRALPLAWQAQALALARAHGLATHLDGARVFNAATRLGVDVKAVAHGFDTVSVCLSKGLGAPMGSVLVGPRAFLLEARRWRKVLGGGLRQAGIIAAAGLYALEHHVDRLAEDHEHARLLASLLEGTPGLSVKPPDTNMVWVEVGDDRVTALLQERGVLVTGRKLLRFVTHLDVSRADIEQAARIISEVVAGVAVTH
jgi:threonine aldolase